MAVAAVRIEPFLKDLQVRTTRCARTVLALGAYGQGSRPALMALLHALADEEESVRRAAVRPSDASDPPPAKRCPPSSTP